MNDLTARQKRILDYIIRYKQTFDGDWPTHRSIMAALDISSTSQVTRHLRLLERFGYVERRNGVLCLAKGRWTYEDETPDLEKL